MRGEDPSRTNNKHCSLTLSQGASREEVAPLGLVAGINFIVNGDGGGITKFYFVPKSWWFSLKKLVFKVHYITLALLLKFGSNAKVQDNEGTTPLHYVAMHCDKKECAALLCAAGASVRSRNHGNVTAVQVARSLEIREYLKQLLKAPPRLEHFCLLAIRKGLGTNLKNADDLPLPRPLKDKILFKILPQVI